MDGRVSYWQRVIKMTVKENRERGETDISIIDTLKDYLHGAPKDERYKIKSNNKFYLIKSEPN